MALEAKRMRDARIRAREPVDPRPLVVRIARLLWEAIWAAERREFWRIAGILSWVGWAMRIDTRDPRLPAWTGLNQDPRAPGSTKGPTS